MSEHGRPVEQPAVKTTIVGGRPPGPGKPLGPIPRGIEVLVKKAAVDPAFKRLLLETRDEAAREIGLALEPAEALMLRAAPREQLQAIIDRTRVHPKLRSAFLGRAAAVMLVALGAGAVGCEEDWGTLGIQPDRPPAEEVEPPAEEATETTPPAEEATGMAPTEPDTPFIRMAGIQPGPVEEAEPPSDAAGEQSAAPRATAAEATLSTPTAAGDTADTPRPGARPITPGVLPGHMPAAGGARPDRPMPDSGAIATKEADGEKAQPAVATLTVPADWTDQDALRAFARGLKHLSTKMLPEHAFTFKDTEDGQIRIAWKTQEYKLEAATNKTGDTEVRDVTGPAADGLILTVWMAKEEGQAQRPQTLDRGGKWKTDLKQVHLLPLKTNLQFNLDYGADTKKNLLGTFSSPQVWYRYHTAPDPSEAATRGVRPDRPPAPTGIRPDRPPVSFGIQPD